jgi:outer membrane protein insertion porin family
MLTARHIEAALAHTLIEPTRNHPYRAVEFRIVSPQIVLESATVTAGPEALLGPMLRAESDAARQPFNDGIAGTTLSDILLAPARNAGHLQAKLVDPKLQTRTAGNILNVTYTARLDAGPVYRLRSVTWKPTPLLSEADFARINTLRPGRVPTQDELAATEKPILDAYRQQGYVDAQVDAAVQTDKATGAVDYTFSVTPGEVYRLRSLNVTGLPADARQEFDALFTLKPNDAFSLPYILSFMNNKPLKALSAYTYSYQTSADPSTHLVDLTLNFKPAR